MEHYVSPRWHPSFIRTPIDAELQLLMLRHFLFLLLTVLTLTASAQQADKWVGTWEMSYQPWPHIPEIHMTLRVAEPVADMLYPAQLLLTHHTFKGEYELLLVKKNDHQLGVGRNKVPLVEEPYGLGPWMMYLNGTLDYLQTDTGANLQLNRLWIDRMGIFMTGLYDNEFYTNTKVYIRNFLYSEDVLLQQSDPTPHTFPNQRRIIETDSIYYGVYDPMETDSPTLEFSIHDEERYDHDTVTVVHNGKVLIDRLPLEEALDLDELSLDSGSNYIAFFADNYGSLPPNTANFIVATTGTEPHLYGFNFGNRSNAFATVMVAPFFYHPPETTATENVTAVEEEVPDNAEVNEVETREEETIIESNTIESNAASADSLNKGTSVAAAETPPLSNRSYTAGRRDVRIGQWEINAEKIDLEIWDEQVEDGDIISIEVNGAVVVDQAEVTTNGRRFGITLKRGRNRILFRAHNLGRIPPNTAALAITANGQERVFHLSTDFERNNVLDIVVTN